MLNKCPGSPSASDPKGQGNLKIHRCWMPSGKHQTVMCPRLLLLPLCSPPASCSPLACWCFCQAGQGARLLAEEGKRQHQRSCCFWLMLRYTPGVRALLPAAEVAASLALLCHTAAAAGPATVAARLKLASLHPRVVVLHPGAAWLRSRVWC